MKAMDEGDKKAVILK
ncbi:hypothetical protein [Bacillus thuringiensis]